MGEAAVSFCPALRSWSTLSSRRACGNCMCGCSLIIVSFPSAAIERLCVCVCVFCTARHSFLQGAAPACRLQSRCGIDRMKLSVSADWAPVLPCAARREQSSACPATCELVFVCRCLSVLCLPWLWLSPLLLAVLLWGVFCKQTT